MEGKLQNKSYIKRALSLANIAHVIHQKVMCGKWHRLEELLSINYFLISFL